MAARGWAGVGRLSPPSASKEEGLGHKANDCPWLTRLLGARGEMVN